MSEQLNETAAEVAALIPKYSWEIMDEPQRDELMERVVLPRYMKTTADGTKLGPTWWAEQIGGTARAFESRVYRIRQTQSEDADAERHVRALSPGRARHVKSGLEKADVEQTEEIIDALPDEALERVAQAVEKRVPQREWTTKPRQAKPSPSVEQQLQTSVFSLWAIQDELQDVALDGEQRVRLLSLIDAGRTFLDAAESRVRLGEIDDDLAALLEEAKPA